MSCADPTQFIIFFTSKVGNFNNINVDVRANNNRSLKHSVERIEVIQNSHFWLLYLDEKDIINAMEESNVKKLNLNVKLLGPDSLFNKANEESTNNFGSLINDLINDETGRRNFLETQINIEIERVEAEKLESKILEINISQDEGARELVSKIIEEERQMVNEIIEMEPHNKFALTQINFLNNYEIENLISKAEKLPDVLNKLEENIKNIRCLISKYPRQRPVFEAALNHEIFRFVYNL